MKTLENKDISKEDKIKKLNEIALEHVDIKGLAMYTLGDLRKSVDEKEKLSLILYLKYIFSIIYRLD